MGEPRVLVKILRDSKKDVNFVLAIDTNQRLIHHNGLNGFIHKKYLILVKATGFELVKP